MKLTIAIPTYNRAGPLAQVLARLAPQLQGRCAVLVLDNASTTPVAPLVEAALPTDAAARVLRHRTNIGAHANIHRAVELAETEWIWVLGDDDLPTTDAVAVILAAIESDPAAAFINFMTTVGVARRERIGRRGATGLPEFVEILDLPNNLNFMSSSVWRVETMLPQLRMAYHYAYSMSWVFAFLLPALASGASVVLHDAAIIEQMTMVEEGDRWSHVNFVLGYPTVLETPMPLALRRRLARKLLHAFGPEHLAAYLLAGLRTADGVQARWLYRLTAGRYRAYFSAAQRVRLWCYGLLFLAPSFSWRCVRIVIAASVAAGLKGVRLSDLESRSGAGVRL